MKVMELEERLRTYKAVCTDVVDGNTIEVEINDEFSGSFGRQIQLNRTLAPERGLPGAKEVVEFLQAHLLGKDCYVKIYKSEEGNWLGEVNIIYGDEVYSLNDMMLESGMVQLR